MGKPSLISIIIPVYNVEKYLRECLDSVTKQTYSEKEVILVDDGSTDASVAICEEYVTRYHFVRVIHKTNRGLSSARNRGIEEARGQWLIFIDSDDVWDDKDCLTKLYRYATSMNLDVVRFEYQAVDDNLKPIEYRINRKTNVIGRVVDNYDMVKYGVAGEWFAVLFFHRRDAIANLRFKEHIRFQEDIDFYCRFFSNCELRCGYLRDRMYLYRKRNASITTTFKVDNLRSSLALSDVFYDAGLKCDNQNLRQLYISESAMVYYWTLCGVLEPSYWRHRHTVLNKCRFEKYRQIILTRHSYAKIKHKYRLFILLSPQLSLILLGIKNRISVLLRNIIK